MIKRITPGSFIPEKHWYPKALNATIHPLVKFFLSLQTDRMINRYCHLNPHVDEEKLAAVLKQPTKYFKWAGADLIKVTTANGRRRFVVIENNSCPSGQKSMPLLDDDREQGGYRVLMERTFLPLLKQKRGRLDGDIAVIYDKNPMECTAYAAVLADLLNEDVWLAHYSESEADNTVRFADGVLEINSGDNKWIPIRAAFRYVTQKPWNRIPFNTKTRILNPIITCLAGGRNKIVASKAYDFYNAELSGSGLKIQTPETIWDVSKNEIPIWVKKMGGHAVVKVPYSNAGQGVYTIINDKELDDFMKLDFSYDRFIVQSLIGNYHWSSVVASEKYYHVCTIPTQKKETYAFDLRMMIGSTSDGLRPICIYTRRAAEPLVDYPDKGSDSWSMLGTNLSIKKDDGTWDSDSNRLMLMDRRDFNKLGLSLDDLIEGFIQTVLSTIAIDNMAKTLINTKGKFRARLFKSLNDDPGLIKELYDS
jgi:hypothetical protein